MVVNQLANFLDIYALGMGAALLYVWLVQRYPAAEKRKAMAWQGIATLLCVLSTWGMLRIFRVQAGESGQAALQAGQMMRRPLLGWPLRESCSPCRLRRARYAFLMGQPGDGLAGGGFDELLPAAPEPGRSPETAGRSTVRQRGTEPGRGAAVAAAIYPAVLWAVPWLGAALITLLIEKPCAKVLKKMFARGKAENKA